MNQHPSSEGKSSQIRHQPHSRQTPVVGPDFSYEVDPADPGNYTHSRLDTTFRSDRKNFTNAESAQPKPDSFFKQHERQLRQDAHKRDTVMHASKSQRISGLDNWIVGIRFVARSAGKDLVTQSKIRYAMVITLSCAKCGCAAESTYI